MPGSLGLRAHDLAGVFYFIYANNRANQGNEEQAGIWEDSAPPILEDPCKSPPIGSENEPN